MKKIWHVLFSSYNFYFKKSVMLFRFNVVNLDFAKTFWHVWAYNTSICMAAKWCLMYFSATSKASCAAERLNFHWCPHLLCLSWLFFLLFMTAKMNWPKYSHQSDLNLSPLKYWCFSTSENCISRWIFRRSLRVSSASSSNVVSAVHICCKFFCCICFSCFTHLWFHYHCLSDGWLCWSPKRQQHRFPPPPIISIFLQGVFYFVTLCMSSDINIIHFCYIGGYGLFNIIHSFYFHNA